jgi:hypothetical protein
MRMLGCKVPIKGAAICFSSYVAFFSTRLHRLAGFNDLIWR